MVDVVTQAQAAEQTVSADSAAAEEMAQQAREVAEQDVPAEVEEPSSENQQEWDDLLAEDADNDMPSDATPGLEDPVPAEEAAVEEVPVEEPTEELPTAEEPAATEEEETPEVIVPPVEEPQDTRTPEEVNKAITEARETARGKLVESFKPTEEQLEQFEEDPGTFFSDMAANLYLDIFDSISQGMRQQMPGMVQGVIAQQKAVQAHEQQFYGAWPELAGVEHRQTVERVSHLYRQQNPTVDNATAVQEIGAQAWVALKLPIEGLVARAQSASTTPAPAPVLTPSHVPAAAGNAPVSARAPAPQKGNEWEQMASELLLDDD